MSRRQEMFTANQLKIGLFGANCSSGRTATLVTERWTAEWDDCVALARMADQAGIDFMLPIGRWKGYGGQTNFHGSTFETMTWASGVLAATERITVFGTVHAPLFHPLIAAKQMVTADQIGRGRFGLNIVAGWNEGEFQMFGVEQRAHEDRYDFAAEWLAVIRRAWGVDVGSGAFEGRFFHLADIEASPKPFGGTRPIIMNAGASAAGERFALHNCDAFFTATGTTRSSMGALKARINEVKAAGRALGRDIEVYTTGQVVCRPTRREAEEYHHHANVENADWEAIERMLAYRGITRANTAEAEFDTKRRFFAERSIGGYPFVGSPDDVAEELAALSQAGTKGVALSFVNYLAELPLFRDEVLPRLVRLGVRVGPA